MRANGPLKRNWNAPLRYVTEYFTHWHWWAFTLVWAQQDKVGVVHAPQTNSCAEEGIPISWLMIKLPLYYARGLFERGFKSTSVHLTKWLDGYGNSFIVLLKAGSHFVNAHCEIISQLDLSTHKFVELGKREVIKQVLHIEETRYMQDEPFIVLDSVAKSGAYHIIW